MTRRSKILSAPALGAALLALATAFSGCEVFEFEMRAVADTAELYSLARPEFVGRPSAFDFWWPQVRVLEEAKGRDSEVASFDAAFTELDGEPVLLPAGMFQTFQISPGIAVIGRNANYDTYDEAPDEGYITDEPVELEEGVLYVVKSRRVNGTCVRYAKFEVLELDPEGVVEFQFFRNDRCNDRLLVEED